VDEVLFLFKNNISNIYLWITVGFLILLLLILDKYFINRFRRDEEKIKLIINEDSTKTEADDVRSKMESKSEIKTPITELKIETSFEPIEQKAVEIPVSNVTFVPADNKVEVMPQPEVSHAPVTPPKAIQPDGPVVVITPFKTLSTPIRSASTNPVEMKRDIKTDLPAIKKDDVL
jgi:hypothetical protein